MSEEHLLKPLPTKDEVAERARLMAGVFKQLTTLNASAIALIAVFMEKMSAGDLLSGLLLAFAPIAFLTSLFCSLMMLITMSMRQQPSEGMTYRLDRDESQVLFGAIMGFTIGLLCLILPAWFRFAGMVPPVILAGVGVVILFGIGVVLGKKLSTLRNA